MMHRKSRLFIQVLVVLLLATLQGCGFHLRGSAELPAYISPIYLSGVGAHDPLRREIRQIFAGADVQLTEDPSEANSVLKVSKQKQDRRVLSVDNRGNVAEYEIHHAVEFELLDSAGKQLMEHQSVGAQRAYENNDTEILGKNKEESLLRRDLRLDLIRRVVNRMQEQLR